MGEYLLGDIANVIDCEHKTAPKVELSEYYSIRTTNISNGKIDYKNSNRVSESTYKEWTKRGIPEEGDIILAREAPVGEVGLIKKGYKVCLGQRTVLIKILSKDIDNKFLLYYLVSPLIKHELRVRAVGSVVSHLNMKDIRNFPINVPPLPEQKAISTVLSSLDEKIDLLHRQNRTLEGMAEVLFREWFVEQGKDDWEEKSLYDCIKLVGGGTPKTKIKEYWNGEIPWLSGGDIASNHKNFILKADKNISEEGLKKSSAKLLPKFSTVISARGTVGKYCLLSKPMAFSQ